MPSRLSVPAESWAPDGTPEIVMSVMVSEAIHITQRHPDIQRDGLVFAAAGGNNVHGGHIGHAGDGDVKVGQRRGGIAIGFRRSGGNGEREVSVGIGGRRDG